MKIPNGLAKNKIADMYYTMEKIRQFEERSVVLYQNGELPGFLHPCIGQEAAVVGVVSALREDDYIVTTHRGHGHVIAKGADVNQMMAELYAKEGGCCKGKGGSMHMIDRTKNILGANGIVGQGITLGTGAALSAILRKTDQVSVCFFGDGAQNEGFFHESMNLASIWNLPVIFACENNMYAESTPQTYHMRPRDIADRAKAYGVTAYIADGNDVMDVYDKAVKAVKQCRKGEGPVLIESKTYKWLGHYVGDPAVYRPAEEVTFWKSEEKEPFARFRKAVSEKGILSIEELDAIKVEVSSLIEGAVKFGQDSKPLQGLSALEDVFHEGIL